MKKSQLEQEIAVKDAKILELQNQIDELKKRASERESFYSDIQKIRAEHHFAEQIQRSMLPQDFDSIKGKYNVDLFADMDTAWEIGGDYYDFFSIDDHRFFFAVGDISGKSVSAALFSMVVKAVIKMAILNGDKLADVAYNTSKQLYQTQSGEHRMFVTLWMGILDVNNGLLSFINAGHEPPLVWNRGDKPHFCEKLSGLPLSSYFNAKKPEKSEYTEHSIALNHNEAILLYTDGVSESSNKNGQLFGHEKIAELTEQFVSEEGSAKEWINYLQRHIISYANHAGRDDDITFLAVKRL